MTTSEKAVEVLKNEYGIDARIYEDNVYLAVWNDELSDTIDVEASKEQVEDWAAEYEEKKQRYSEEDLMSETLRKQCQYHKIPIKTHNYEKDSNSNNGEFTDFMWNVYHTNNRTIKAKKSDRL